MYGPMAHQYAGNEVAAALTPGSNEGSAHGKLHHSTNNSRVVLCPFFLKQFFRGQCLWFCQQKKKPQMRVCVATAAVHVLIFLYFSLFISINVAIDVFGPALAISFLFPCAPQLCWLIIDCCLWAVGRLDRPAHLYDLIDSIHHTLTLVSCSFSLSLRHTHSLSRKVKITTRNRIGPFFSLFFLFLARIAGELSISPHTHPPESNKGLSFFFLFL